MAGDQLYYSLVLISFIFLLVYFRNFVSWFIILLFYDGLFAYYGSTVWNSYKFMLPFFAVFIAVRAQAFSKKNLFNQQKLLWIFLIFSTFFFFSAILNNDYLTLTLNQYSKYFLFLASFFIIKRLILNQTKLNYQVKLLVYLLIIQGVLSVIKFFLFGVRESVIGTVAYIGGAAGTVLPILGFVFLWAIRQGKLNIKDWVIVILLLFIGFGSMKRAIWFIMPVVVFLFMQYIPQKRYTRRTLIYIPVIVLTFYIGIRLNPTLNPESDYWGKFDLNYAYTYAKKYSFGDEENTSEGVGRVGGTYNLIKSFFQNSWTSNTLFGFGLKEIYATSSEEFDAAKYGINHKGSATGIFQSYISGGVFALITTLLLALTVILYVQNARIRIALLAVFLWEYLFYTGIILRTPSLSFLLVFCIVYLEHMNRTRSLSYGLNKVG